MLVRLLRVGVAVPVLVPLPLVGEASPYWCGFPRVSVAAPFRHGRNEAGEAVDAGGCHDGADGDDDAAGAARASVAHRQT